MAKSLIKETIIYGIASVFPKLINFTLVAIFTEVFSPSSFSLQTIWYVYAALFNVILTLGFETGFFRFYTSGNKQNATLTTCFTVLLIVSLTFGLLATIFRAELSHLLSFEDNKLVVILIWTTVIDTIVVIPFAYLRVQRKAYNFLFLKLSNIIFLYSLTVFFLIIAPKLYSENANLPMILGMYPGYIPSVYHIIIANLCASIFTLLCFSYSIVKIGLGIDRQIVKTVLKYSLPIMVSGIAFVINENVDKLMIPQLLSDTDNGIYAACYKLSVFMTLYITAFRLGIEPLFFKLANTDNAKVRYAEIMHWFVLLGCIFIVCIVAFLHPISQIFLRQEIYLSGLVIVPILLVANLFFGIYQNLAVWYKVTDRTHIGMNISWLGAAITFVSLWIFLSLFGIVGGAIATCLTYGIMMFVSYYLGQKYYPVPYDVKSATIHIALACIFASIMFYFQRFEINIALTIFYIAIIYFVERAKINEILFSLTKPTK